jgi:hypothetical protein
MIIPLTIETVTSGTSPTGFGASVQLRGFIEGPPLLRALPREWRAFIETEPDKTLMHIAVFGRFESENKNSILVLQQGEVSIEVDLREQDLRELIYKLARIQSFNHPEEHFGVTV